MATMVSTTITVDAAGESAPFSASQVPAGQLWVQTDSAGAFVGSAVLEVTLDGVNWVSSGYGAVAPGQYAQVPELAKYVRVNATAYTSGTLSVTIAGSADD